MLIIEDILKKIPTYDVFYSVDELDEFSKNIEQMYPKIVKRNEIGRSRNNHPIYCLTIGSGSKNALCFACPHPNEPIGAMTLVSLARIFVENQDILRDTNFTWNLIFCIDPDGTKLNESWFKGPFNLLNYIKGFYRPVGYEQVEWTFPINYKSLQFNSPIPETKALITLIDKLKPEFMYSLHNLAFGGAYWYSTESDAKLCQLLEKSANRQNIPLHLGEPEALYITKYSSAVHSMMSMIEYCDYIERCTGSLPNNFTCGTCSADYVNSVCKCLTLMAEVPYFYDSKIEDLTLTEMSRKDAILEDVRLSKIHTEYIKNCFNEIGELFSKENKFIKLVSGIVDEGLQSCYEKEQWANNEDFKNLATVSEKFDNLILKRVFECLNLALIIRACDFEKHMNHTDEEIQLIEKVKTQVNNDLIKEVDYIEQNSNYEVIEIKRLVCVQIESALHAINYLNGQM